MLREQYAVVYCRPQLHRTDDEIADITQIGAAEIR